MKPKSLTTIAALVVIGAGGFMAGRISSSDSSSVAKDELDGARPTRSSSRSEMQGPGGSGKRSSRTARAERAGGGSGKSAVDSLARLESIVRGENALDRSRALLAYIDQLSPGEFEDAVAHFRSLGITEDRFGEYGMLLSAWADVDPTAALSYAKENTGTRFATNTILTSWASADPDGALRWAESNHEGEGANPYFAGIIRSLAGTDPLRATDLLTGMPRSTQRGHALDAMLPHVMRMGGDEARTWISAITDESLRNGAMMRAADELAAIDPAGTAVWLMENPGEASQRRMDDVYSTWVRNDQQAAMTALSSIPSGDVRSNALRGVVSGIAREDPSAAISVMDRYPNDVTDRVVENFVWRSFRSDPSVAINEISRIQDESERNQMYGRAVGGWLARDEAAATAWISNNPLPEGVQERIDRRRNRER